MWKRAQGWARARRDELRRLEKRVLVGGFVAALCLWAFVAIQGRVASGTPDLDDRIALALHERGGGPAGPPWLRSLARDVTALGSGPIVLALVAVVALGFAASGRKRQAILVPFACVGGLLLGTLLKNLTDRERPSAVHHATETFTSSFPSGHALNAAVVYLTLAAIVAESSGRRRMIAFSLATGISLALLVGITRVYLGVHHPTDVLAGWALGFGWAALCWLVGDRFRARASAGP